VATLNDPIGLFMYVLLLALSDVCVHNHRDDIAYASLQFLYCRVIYVVFRFLILQHREHFSDSRQRRHRIAKGSSFSFMSIENWTTKSDRHNRHISYARGGMRRVKQVRGGMRKVRRACWCSAWFIARRQCTIWGTSKCKFALNLSGGIDV
jgi:hypothetical protein